MPRWRRTRVVDLTSQSVPPNLSPASAAAVRDALEAAKCAGWRSPLPGWRSRKADGDTVLTWRFANGGRVVVNVRTREARLEEPQRKADQFSSGSLEPDGEAVRE